MTDNRLRQTSPPANSGVAAALEQCLDCHVQSSLPGQRGQTGYSPPRFPIRHHYEVAVLDPIQTARQVTKGIRKTQTDRIDAQHIAVLLKNGEHRPAIIPGELAMTCRQLSRLQQTMVRQESRIKQW